MLVFTIVLLSHCLKFYYPLPQNSVIQNMFILSKIYDCIKITYYVIIYAYIIQNPKYNTHISEIKLTPLVLNFQCLGVGGFNIF